MHDPAKDPVLTCSPEKWRNVPNHKSLFSVPAGKGLPIGNLTSQFFANVYLNSLDHFVKHTLKARYYIRYADDFVLLHEDRKKLCDWVEQIAEFLKDRLKLELHPNRHIIRPVSNGIDFLGYIVRPSHLYIRNRVAKKCKDVVIKQTKGMLSREGEKVSLFFPEETYQKLYLSLNSYLGAFSHASCNRLIKSLFDKTLVLRALFLPTGFKVIKKWRPNFKPANLYTQYRFFRKKFFGVIVFQTGCFLELYDKNAVQAAKDWGMKRVYPRIRNQISS